MSLISNIVVNKDGYIFKFISCFNILAHLTSSRVCYMHTTDAAAVDNDNDDDASDECRA